MIDPLMFIALLPAVVLVVYICRKDRTEIGRASCRERV